METYDVESIVGASLLIAIKSLCFGNTIVYDEIACYNLNDALVYYFVDTKEDVIHLGKYNKIKTKMYG